MSTSGFERFPGGWSFPPETGQPGEESKPAGEQPAEDGESAKPTRATPQPATDNGAAAGEQPAQAPPRERHWRPRTCRICFEVVQPTFNPPPANIPAILQPKPNVTYESEDGPLLSPCKCKGSSKYVHESCLQAWRNADPNNRRNFWQCPTCGFKYRLSRLGWGMVIASRSAQIALTVFILFLVVFFLGFVADPIMGLYYDPSSFITEGLTGSAYDDVYDFEDEGPETWVDHFLKGFASLGLISFLKVLFASPFYWLRSSGFGTGGRRAGTTGRDRMANVSWLIVVIGVITFLVSVYKLVRLWTGRFLQSAGHKVMDVQNDDDDDEDEGEEAGGGPAAPGPASDSNAPKPEPGSADPGGAPDPAAPKAEPDTDVPKPGTGGVPTADSKSAGT